MIISFRNNIYLYIYLLLIIVILIELGFNFPIPWGDEAAFIFQAIAFSETNSLFTNVLSDSKIIMWMQPGYMIIQGIFYKIFGYSFELARMISWLFYLLSIFIFYKILQKYFHKNSLYILMLVFILPSGLAIANVARMESSIIFLYLLSVYFLLEKKYILVFSLLIIGILFHFNIVYFGLTFLIVLFYDYIIFEKKVSSFFKASKQEYFIFIISILFLLLYVIFVYINWINYENDMAFQFTRKLDRVPFYFSLRNLIIIFIMIVFSTYLFIKKERNYLLLSLSSLSMFILWANGQEIWYEFFLFLAITNLYILFIDIFNKKIFQVIFISLYILIIFKSLFLSFYGMKLNIYDEQYIDEFTKFKIYKIIKELKTKYHKENLTLYVNRGNALMFYNFSKKENIKLIYLLPKDIEKNRKVDIAIYIYRDNDPEWLKNFPIFAEYNMAKIISTKNNEVRVILNE